MSTGKTGRLRLNQWALQDRFSMEEFNADNRAVDAAVVSVESAIIAQKTATDTALAAQKSEAEAALTAQKSAADAALAAHSSESAAAISQLWAAKTELVKLKDITTTAQANSVEFSVSDINWSLYHAVVIVINANGNGHHYVHLGTGQSQSGLCTGGASLGNNVAYMSQYGRDCITVLLPRKDGTQKIVSFTIDGNSGTLCSGKDEKSDYSALTVIKLLPMNSVYYVSAGARMMLWGVK